MKKITSAAVAQTTAEAKALMAEIKKAKNPGRFLWHTGEIEWQHREDRPVFILTVKNNRPSTLAQLVGDLNGLYNYIFIFKSLEGTPTAARFDVYTNKAIASINPWDSLEKKEKSKWGDAIDLIRGARDTERERKHASQVFIILQETGGADRVIAEKRKARKEAREGAVVRYIATGCACYYKDNITGREIRVDNCYGAVVEEVDRSGYNMKKAHDLREKAHDLHRENEKREAQAYNTGADLIVLDSYINRLQQDIKDLAAKYISEMEKTGDLKTYTSRYTARVERAADIINDILKVKKNLINKYYYRVIDIQEAINDIDNDILKFGFYASSFINANNDKQKEALGGWYHIEKLEGGDYYYKNI